MTNILNKYFDIFYKSMFVENYRIVMIYMS